MAYHGGNPDFETEFQKLMRIASPPKPSRWKEIVFQIWFWGGSILAILMTGVAVGLLVSEYAYRPIWLP